LCHDKTPPKTLEKVCRESEIIVVAVGIPDFLDERHVSPGAVVIDVGITRLEQKVVGDVNFEAIKNVASAITPVPGGVGPATIVMLLSNTLEAYKMQNRV
jgi:methylenetetrahydrofolate dehydrogenase (NADP+)/methenyltetrahydrofolate cyclohydrolase